MDELLEMLKTRLRYDGDTEDSILTQHLTMAVNVINDRRQYEPTDTDVVESKYKYIAVEMAVCTYNKMGAEGQIGHGENEVYRTYETGMYPSSLLRLVVPKPRG